MDQIQWIFSGIGCLLLGGIAKHIFGKKENTVQDDLKTIEKKIDEIHTGITDEKILKTENVQIIESGTAVNPVELAKRVITIFEEHGILRQQIPSFVNGEFDITYRDIVSEESFINVLTPEFLNWLTKKFGVRREWLDGVDDVIYRAYDVYKNASTFKELIFSIMIEHSTYTPSDKIRVYMVKEPVEFMADSTKKDTAISFLIRSKLEMSMKSQCIRTILLKQI